MKLDFGDEMCKCQLECNHFDFDLLAYTKRNFSSISFLLFIEFIESTCIQIKSVQTINSNVANTYSELHFAQIDFPDPSFFAEANVSIEHRT